MPAPKDSEKYKLWIKERSGKNHPLYGTHCSEETKRKIREKAKNRKLTGETKKRIGDSNRGKVRSEEAKRNIKANHADFSGKNNPMFGKHHTKETKEIQSEAQKGRRCSKEAIEINRESHKGQIAWNKNLTADIDDRILASENHPNWKNGISPLVDLVRHLSEYKSWRDLIFKRDNYTCQDCGEELYSMVAHHTPISFDTIFKQFLFEYDQFSPIEDKETLVRLAMKYNPFWSMEGITLCKKHHKKRHSGKMRNKSYV